MEITPAALDAIFYGFDKRFQEGLTSAPVWWPQVATQVPSTGRENRYPWLDKIPRLREWVGERVINGVSLRSYALVNKDYEDTISLDRNTIEDDQIAAFAPGVRMLGDASARWPDDLMAGVMQGGAAAAAAGYDGQPFFSANHPTNMDQSGSTTQSNLFTSGTSGACALTPSNYQAVRQAMQLYNGADGKPLGINPNLLIAPPQLEPVARQILNADFIAPAGGFGAAAATGSTSNVLKGTADLLILPQLGNESTAWYLADKSKPIMPFIFQLRKAPNLISLTSPTDPNLFYRKEFIYGVDARGAGGYGLWWLCARAVG